MTAPITLSENLEQRFHHRNHVAHWEAIVSSMRLSILDDRYLTAGEKQAIGIAINEAQIVLDMARQRKAGQGDENQNLRND